jgi:signal transduction histidine kinase
MTSPRSSRTLYIVWAVLLVLLPLLAILQYRWIGEVSQGQKRQLEDHLNQAGMQFAQDFDRELNRLLGTFQLRGSTADSDLSDTLAQRFDEASATFPGLVKALFVVQRQNNEVELQKLDMETRKLTGVAWPDDFSALRENLEQRASGARNMRGPGAQEFDAGNRPVFAVPLADGRAERREPPFETPFGGRGSMPRIPGPPPFRGMAIIELDHETLVQEFIHTILARHFALESGAEYRIAIATRGTNPQVIYRSDEAFGTEDMQSPDLRIPLFGFEMGRGRGPGGASAAGSGAGAGRPPGEFSRGGRGPGVLGGGMLPGMWQLLIKHRSGSVDAAIGSLRRRNLAVSFGILLLLTSSIFLVVASSHRARALAQLQMDFVARVSHELRTPLAIIRSAAYNVANGVVSDENEVREYAAMVQTQGQRLSTMVDQILTFSRTESGHDTYDSRPLDIDETLDRVVSTMLSALSQAHCEVVRDVAHNLPMVQADERAFTECLQNLLTNAMKYGRNGSAVNQIRIEARRADRNTVTVSVADSGPGIDPPDLAHIFEPFFRGKNARSDTPGSGLGLNLVRRMMNAQGGRVTVESEPGQGARFTLHLTAISETES